MYCKVFVLDFQLCWRSPTPSLFSSHSLAALIVFRTGTPVTAVYWSLLVNHMQYLRITPSCSQKWRKVSNHHGRPTYTYQCIHSRFHLVSGGPFNGVPSRFPSLLGLTLDVCNMNSLSHIKLRNQKEKYILSRRW